jgi:hypothetical protein
LCINIFKWRLCFKVSALNMFEYVFFMFTYINNLPNIVWNSGCLTILTHATSCDKLCNSLLTSPASWFHRSMYFMSKCRPSNKFCDLGSTSETKMVALRINSLI